MLLEVEGFTVVDFASAAEFLHAARPVGHSCLLLDIQMPGIAGSSCSSSSVATKTPISVVVMTVYAAARHFDENRASGAALTSRSSRTWSITDPVLGHLPIGGGDQVSRNQEEGGKDQGIGERNRDHANCKSAEAIVKVRP